MKVRCTLAGNALSLWRAYSQVLAWVNGAKFVDLCTMTKQFEGSIIRVIRRLEELCRQLSDAAKAVGDEALERKFKEASSRMRRDIIFAASLYL